MSSLKSRVLVAVVGVPVLVAIVLWAPDPGTAGIHNTDGNAQSAPDLIDSPHHFFPGLHRESAAILTLALASEFLPGKIFDFLPEDSGFTRV